jgi:RNA-binding protein
VNPIDRKKLKTQAHNLKPVVMVGQAGLTEAVFSEINLALDSHELIKVKIRSSDRLLRQQICTEMCTKTNAELIQKIGQIVVIYRKKAK